MSSETCQQRRFAFGGGSSLGIRRPRLGRENALRFARRGLDASAPFRRSAGLSRQRNVFPPAPTRSKASPLVGCGVEGCAGCLPVFEFEFGFEFGLLLKLDRRATWSQTPTTRRRTRRKWHTRRRVCTPRWECTY